MPIAEPAAKSSGDLMRVMPAHRGASQAEVARRTGQTKFPDERLALERKLSLVEARIRYFVEEVANGRMPDALYHELQNEEAAKKALTAQLEDLPRLTQVASLDAKRIERGPAGDEMSKRVAVVIGEDPTTTHRPLVQIPPFHTYACL